MDDGVMDSTNPRKKQPKERKSASSKVTKRQRPLKPQTTVPPTESANRWTFLTNHAHVLIALHANPDLVLREVAILVGITERAVQRIIQDLEDEGFIRRQKIGRKNHYDVITEKSLRHALEAHRKIGDLLNLVKA